MVARLGLTGMHSHRFWTFRHGVAGIVLQAAAYLFAAGGFVLMAFASARESTPFALLAFVIFFSSPVLYKFARRLRTRIIIDLTRFLDQLDKSGCPLVLYLREFGADTAANHMPPSDDLGDWTVTDEERVVSALRGYGALVAIGRPGERLPPGGGYRLYVPDDRWQTQVEDLIDRARIIVVRCGMTAGVRWELEKISEKGKLDRTVFVAADSESNISVYRKLFELASGEPPEPTSVRSSFERLRETVREKKQSLPDEFPGTSYQELVEIEKTLRISEKMTNVLELVGVSVLVLTESGVEQLDGPLDDALPKAMNLIGREPMSRGIIDTENPWQLENIIAVLSVVTAVLLILAPLAVFGLPPLFDYLGFAGASAFIKANFIYFLLGLTALFFLAFILRP